jgi:DNA topoisomerase IA
MRLFIAASRSIARSIADALHRVPNTRQVTNDYIKIGDDVVTWCDCRLLELCGPAFYDSRWAKWDAGTLPIRVPYDKWQLTPRLVKKSLPPDPEAKKRLAAIEDLLKIASTVVNAGNPDSEGPFLIDELIDYFGYRGQVMRLMLDEKVPVSGESLETSMQDNSKYRNVHLSELCRSRANWLVGNNMSRAVTKLLAGDQLVSIGRIQTPMLGLIVRHCMEIESEPGTDKKYYTKRTLIREMQQFARCGAHDIDALKLRGFIEVDGATGQIKDTAWGRSLVLALPAQLTDVTVAAAWEGALGQVAAGTYSPEEFMRRIDIYVDKRLHEIKALSGKVTVCQGTPGPQSHQKKRFEPRARTTDKSATAQKEGSLAKPSC